MIASSSRASAVTSSAGTSTPSRPDVMMSAAPRGQSKLTTASPAPIASTITIPNPPAHSPRCTTAAAGSRPPCGRGSAATRRSGTSDHASFAAGGVPIGGIFTGLDDCYHRRCDTLRNVDSRVLAESARAAEGVLAALAR